MEEREWAGFGRLRCWTAAGGAPRGLESQGLLGRGGGLQLSSEDSSLCSNDPEGKEGISDEGPPL